MTSGSSYKAKKSEMVSFNRREAHPPDGVSRAVKIATFARDETSDKMASVEPSTHLHQFSPAMANTLSTMHKLSEAKAGEHMQKPPAATRGTAVHK